MFATFNDPFFFGYPVHTFSGNDYHYVRPVKQQRRRSMYQQPSMVYYHEPELSAFSGYEDPYTAFYRRQQPSCYVQPQRSATLRKPTRQDQARLQQQQQRQALLKKYHGAATKIQRAYRQHREERRHFAASIIQNAFRDYLHSRQPEEQRVAIRQIHKIHSDLKQHQQKFRRGALNAELAFDLESGRVLFSGESKEFLGYEDGLIKLMLRVDGIMSNGDEVVRDCRKALVGKIQHLLNEIDQYRSQELERFTDDSASVASDDSSMDIDKLFQ